MENLSTLMGKYGEEGDKLLFKILNSGDCFAGISDEELMEKNPLRFFQLFMMSASRESFGMKNALRVIPAV